jgi:hypothetical protein
MQLCYEVHRNPHSFWQKTWQRNWQNSVSLKTYNGQASIQPHTTQPNLTQTNRSVWIQSANIADQETLNSRASFFKSCIYINGYDRLRKGRHRGARIAAVTNTSQLVTAVVWHTESPIGLEQGALSPGVKKLECEADHSYPPNAEVRWRESVTILLPCICGVENIDVKRQFYVAARRLKHTAELSWSEVGCDLLWRSNGLTIVV